MYISAGDIGSWGKAQLKRLLECKGLGHFSLKFSMV